MAHPKINKPLKRCFIIFYFVILVISPACTSSPISENSNIDVPKRQITGQVSLKDNGNPEGTFVWFEGFNSNTRVNQAGNFELSIPIKQTQGGKNGISGIFNIYYYIANYELSNSKVVTKNGEFVYSSGDLNKDGILFPVSLERNLKINTRVTPDSISDDYTGFIDVEVSLLANNPVQVEFPFSVPNTLGAILACCDSLNQMYAFRAFPNVFTSSVIDVQDSLITRRLSFNLSTINLPTGRYEIIPYLFVHSNNVPSELIINLGDTVKALGPEYLNMPIKRSGGNFMLTIRQ